MRYLGNCTLFLIRRLFMTHILVGLARVRTGLCAVCMNFSRKKVTTIPRIVLFCIEWQSLVGSLQFNIRQSFEAFKYFIRLSLIDLTCLHIVKNQN